MKTVFDCVSKVFEVSQHGDKSVKVTVVLVPAGSDSVKAGQITLTSDDVTLNSIKAGSTYVINVSLVQGV